jgi:hypothetical protein
MKVKELLKKVEERHNQMVEWMISNPTTTTWKDSQDLNCEYYEVVGSEEQPILGTITGMHGVGSGLLAWGACIRIEIDGGKKISEDAKDFPGAFDCATQANGIRGVRVRLVYRITKLKYRLRAEEPSKRRELIRVEIISTPEEVRAAAKSLLEENRVEMERELRRSLKVNGYVGWVLGPLSLLTPVTEGRMTPLDFKL